MTDLLQTAIDRLVGAGNGRAVPPRNGGLPGALPAPVVFSLNPSRRTQNDLAGRGYAWARNFVALPSFTSPRWLFPLGNPRCAQQGLRIYQPYARIARTVKGLLTAAAAAPCQGMAPNRVLVASRGPLPLEDLVREVTGECQPVFALSLGNEARFQKLTVQVMRPEGEIMGYIKLPLTDAASVRVSHEAKILNHLWSFPALRPHIPRVLYSGKWGNGAILYQSGGPSRPGPVRFSGQCEDFLRVLGRIHASETPGHMLWDEVAARWRKSEPCLSCEWQALGQAALARARREIDGVMIPCSVAHGDFAPWNIRAGDGCLYVFDWESASWPAPTLWDAFHFKTQVEVLLNKKSDWRIFDDRLSGERASFMLYLLHSVCDLLDEESPARGIGIECRRQLLAKQLERY
jgi:hypothetical protein